MWLRLGLSSFVLWLMLPSCLYSQTSTLMVQRLSKAQFEFSLNLYSELTKHTEGNLCFSPYNLATLLTMLFYGSEKSSTTNLQLKEALKINGLSEFEINNTSRFISEELSAVFYKQITGMANGLILDGSIRINHPYLETVRRTFKTDVFQFDFRNKLDFTNDMINRWIKNRTDDNLSVKLTKRNAKLVLMSIAKLDSKWLYPFDLHMTFEKGLFYISSKNRIEVPLMIGRFKLPLGYSMDLESRVLELPFVSKRVSLFILLPDDMEGGLEKLESNLSVETVKTLLSTLKDERVNIRLPRMKLDVDVDMVQALKGIGITEMFDEEVADFREVNSNDNLFVSEILHRTVIDIHEASSESGNKLDVSDQIGAFGDKYFEVDHPFIFLVWDYPTGTALYLGRVVSPETT